MTTELERTTDDARSVNGVDPSLAITRRGEPLADHEVEPRVKALAKLSPIEYDRRRTEEAADLGVRVQTLDAEIARNRPVDAKQGAAGGSAIHLAAPEPWPDRVDGGEMLSALCESFRRFLALPEYAAETIALWVVHAHAHDASQISPILALCSPEKRCGKTTALGLLNRLVPRPLPASNITSAALFRATEKWCPTLLIDEADTFLRGSDELRGILNSGHNRAQASVIRTTGDDHEPRQFRTWAPKAIALIGLLPATLEDRAIRIAMRRRRLDEPVERTRGDRDHGLSEIASRCARWVIDHTEALVEADPDLPGALHDRAADNWRALVAIADAAGGDWPRIARAAAKALNPTEDGTSLGEMLLEDVRSAFDAAAKDRMKSDDLVTALVAMPDRPWSEIQRGERPLTTNALARRLKLFAIRPRKLRFGPITAQGYKLASFAESFDRYLPAPVHPQNTGTPEQISELHGL